MKEKKYITKKQKLLFGKYKNKSIHRVPHSYLIWMIDTIELSTIEKAMVNKVLLKKGEKQIQQQVIKEMSWLR